MTVLFGFLPSIALAAAAQGVPVPPPPSIVDMEVVNNVARAIVKGDAADLSVHIAQDATVGTAIKYPNTQGDEIQFEGEGPLAAKAQAELIAKELGATDGASCSALKDNFSAMCKFSVPSGKGVWLGFMTSRDGKVDLLKFVYVSRALVEKKMKGQH